MAVTTGSRIGVTRWSAGTDPFTRAQMDGSHGAIEAKAAGFLEGTFAARPAAAAGNQGFLYVVTSAAKAGSVYYSTGAAWLTVLDTDVQPTTRQFARSFLLTGV